LAPSVYIQYKYTLWIYIAFGSSKKWLVGLQEEINSLIEELLEEQEMDITD
jgi:hypothetical protein